MMMMVVEMMVVIVIVIRTGVDGWRRRFLLGRFQSVDGRQFEYLRWFGTNEIKKKKSSKSRVSLSYPPGTYRLLRAPVHVSSRNAKIILASFLF